MKATYIPTAETKFTTAHRRENGGYLHSYQVIDLAAPKRWGGPEQPRIDSMLDLRIYGTQAKNTACLWIHTDPIHTSGSGSAGGYGYHRPSAAAWEAIHNAGFRLDRDIAGVGDDAIREAVIAVARAAGAVDPVLIESHA